MNLATATASAVANLIVFAAIPLAIFALHGRLRHGLTLRESLAKAGLQRGETRYALWAGAASLLIVAVLAVLPLPTAALTRKGSGFEEFRGLGLSAASIAGAFLYGYMKTGLAEEILFRGLIAGSLARVLPLAWANLIQGVIFLLPHLAILAVAPELGWILPVSFAAGLLNGWLRIRSGSILGGVLLHGAANFGLALNVAHRT